MKASPPQDAILNRVAAIIAFAAGIFLLALQFSCANGTVVKALGP